MEVVLGLWLLLRGQQEAFLRETGTWSACILTGSLWLVCGEWVACISSLCHRTNNHKTTTLPTAENNTSSLCQFPGSVQVWVSWVFCSGSHQAGSKLSFGAMISSEALGPLPVSLIVGRAHILVVAELRSHFPASCWLGKALILEATLKSLPCDPLHRQLTTWLFASSRPEGESPLHFKSLPLGRAQSL